MRRRQKQQLHMDNRGSIMILVLVCLFVVSLLGAMVLSTTVVNHKMKATQMQASDNFYDAEAVMEEVTVRIRQTLMDAYRESYETLLIHYLDAAVANDRQTFFILDIANRLGLSPQEAYELGYGIYVAKNMGSFRTVLDTVNAQLSGYGSLEIPETDMVVIDVKKQSFRMKDITLHFTDEMGYQTQIRADLVLEVAMPDDSFVSSGTQINRYVDDYVIITNSDIIADSSGTGGAGGTVAKVNGSLYAGGNLQVEAGLDIAGERVVLGESLILPDGSHLSASMGQMEHNGIWARNIELAGGRMNLIGDCFVVDDTTFSEENSELTILGGGYYGYSYSEAAEGDPYLSSAILINKPNTTLDLSEADMLWLAGNAYIRESKLFDDLGAMAVDGVLEGESIAYKNLQSAYLLPGCCIVGVGHNPVMMTQTFSKKQGEVLEAAYLISEPGKITQTVMTAVKDIKIGGSMYAKDTVIPAGTELPIGTILPKGTILPCDVSTPIVDMVLNRDPQTGGDFTEDGYYIDLEISRTEVGIDLSDYADALQPVIVRYSNTKKMAYYYLRTLNPEKAAEYFQDFAKTENGAHLLKQLETLERSNVLLPKESANIVTVGNLTEYKYNSVSGQADYGVNEANSADNILWREALLTSSYNALLTKLTPGGRLDTSAQPVEPEALDMFHYLISPTFFAQEGEELLVETYEDDLGNQIQFCAARGLNIETDEISSRLGTELTNAVIITDGDVLINTSFAGVVIAKGEVTLNVSGDSERLAEGVTGLANLIRHKEIGPYFQAYKPTEEKKEDSNRLQMSELIRSSFENWVKN